MFIPDPDPDFLPIPNPGVKQVPDPESGTARHCLGEDGRVHCHPASLRQPGRAGGHQELCHQGDFQAQVLGAPVMGQ